MKSRIMYIENKETGEAKIGRVTFSKTGKTIYYSGSSFLSSKGHGVSGNYFDLESGEEYWISGCKKNGKDAHWAEPANVSIDDDVKKEYWVKIRGKEIE
jgi:hypothetical protein